jgi:hypothetical protein
MNKLYESIVQEEHLASSARDVFEESRHINSIVRIKTLLEKEKEDFRERVDDFKQIKVKNSN